MWFIKFLCGFIVVMCTISLLVAIIVFSIMYKRKKKEMREWQKYKDEHVVQFGKSNSRITTKTITDYEIQINR